MAYLVMSIRAFSMFVLSSTPELAQNHDFFKLLFKASVRRK